MINGIYLLLGIVLLTAGGETLIRGALGVASRFGVSPLLSGLVIVGFGTSMPELVVSIDAAKNGQPDIAIGNVVGSNIGNVLLILGVCALITPLAVTPVALRRDATVVIGAGLLFAALTVGGALSRIDGLILLTSLFAYLVWAWQTERTKKGPASVLHEAEAAEVTVVPKSAGWSILAVAIGLGLLIAGSRILLTGAIGLARGWNISEALIGLTLVAVGTSLPEFSISVIAAIRRHADVAIGNVLGSNIFNLLGILGFAALMNPMQIIDRVIEFDQWVMIGASLLLLVFLYTGRRLDRLEGCVLLAAYALYTGVSVTLGAP